jgi:putative tryptophan/tyrosine transport system substrate-binding protein
MRRRKFLLMVGWALAVPLAGQAQQRQQGKTLRIGFLGDPAPAPRDASVYGGFVQGMRELGYFEGRDFVIASVAVGVDDLAQAARKLVQDNVDLILAMRQSDAVRAAQHATSTIPIVFVIADDPVASRLVTSLSRPGGNSTGLTSLTAQIDGKRLELLKEAVPTLRRAALLAASADPATSQIVQAVKDAARRLEIQLDVLYVASLDNLGGTLKAAASAGDTAIAVAGSPIFFLEQSRIAQWAMETGVPVISPWKELPAAGGLLSYGVNVREMFRQSATFVVRILKGANPADLPVEQATKFELVINLRAAKALGLTIPPALLARADEVIE